MMLRSQQSREFQAHNSMLGGAVYYDVLVAGAGPAGSSAARDIARAGFKVLMVEKRRAVGHPVFCSGLVTPRTLEEAGIGDGLVLNQIKGVSVHSVSGEQLHLGGDKVYAHAIDRAGLDKKLVEQAQQAGAQLLLDARLASIEREGRGLRLTLSGKGRAQKVGTKLLIGADGVHSLVARWLGTHDPNGVVHAIGAEGWLDRGEPDRAQVFLGSS